MPASILGGGRAGLLTPKAAVLHIPPATGRKWSPSPPLPQPCPDKEPNTKCRVIDLFHPTLSEIPILMNERNQPSPLHTHLPSSQLNSSVASVVFCVSRLLAPSFAIPPWKVVQDSS